MKTNKQEQFKKLFPKGWKLERVYQVTDPKGNPRAWSSEWGVAILMAHKALAFDRNAQAALVGLDNYNKAAGL